MGEVFVCVCVCVGKGGWGGYYALIWSSSVQCILMQLMCTLVHVLLLFVSWLLPHVAHTELRVPPPCITAASHLQAGDLAKFVPQDPEAVRAAAAELLNAAEMEALVPGLQAQRIAASPPLSTAPLTSVAAGLFVRNAVVLHPLRYMHALWAACGQQAERAGGASSATLHLRQVASLGELEAAVGGRALDGVVVAAGAALGSIAETAGVLPLDMCHGYTLEMELKQEGQQGQHGAMPDQASGSTYPASAPSLLGSTYIAAHGSRSLVVGATKRYGVSPSEALEACRRGGAVGDPAAQEEAARQLLPAAAEVWPPLEGWQVWGCWEGGHRVGGSASAIHYQHPTCMLVMRAGGFTHLWCCTATAPTRRSPPTCACLFVCFPRVCAGGRRA
jgi:hypothetical protein